VVGVAGWAVVPALIATLPASRKARDDRQMRSPCMISLLKLVAAAELKAVLDGN
jgi:hypothetical protein